MCHSLAKEDFEAHVQNMIAARKKKIEKEKNEAVKMVPEFMRGLRRRSS